MNTQTFTAGPWLTDDVQEGDLFRYVYAAKGIVICRVDTFSEGEANARLIAAAPELLAALRVALEQLESWEQEIDGEWGSCRTLAELEADGELSEATLTARAAITKATGASNES